MRRDIREIQRRSWLKRKVGRRDLGKVSESETKMKGARCTIVAESCLNVPLRSVSVFISYVIELELFIFFINVVFLNIFFYFFYFCEQGYI